MRPGERVRTIESIRDLLTDRTWPATRLVVEGFGFEWRQQDSYESSEEYLLSVLSKGPDDELRELLIFLRGEDAEPVRPDTEQAWGEKPVRVFLSHVHEHRHLVGGVKRVLAERYAIDAFVAHDDIEPMKKWREVIKSALSTCDLFVAFLHDGFHASQWCDQEAGWALGRNIPILTVRPEGVGRHDGFLEEHQDMALRSDAAGNLERGVALEIFVAAVSDGRTKDKGADALIEAFVGSWSYDATRYFWNLIERLPTFTSGQLRRLEYAVEVNDQVSSANVKGELVPILVKSLVERFQPPSHWTNSDEPPF